MNVSSRVAYPCLFVVKLPSPDCLPDRRFSSSYERRVPRYQLMLCLIDQDEEAALEAKKKKEAREREDAKRRLSNYKTAKELAQERRKAEEEHAKLVEKEKAKISADQLERIRTRNRTLTMEHMNLVRRKAEEERQRQQRVEALKDAVPGPDVDRDPSRLTALTAASVAKRDANMRRNGEEPERPGYFAIMRPTTIAHNPSRLVPSWRAGL